MPNTEQLLYQSDKWLYPVLESLFHKVPVPKACNFVKKRLQHMCFPVDKFLRTPILKNICVRLLLNYFRKWLYETFTVWNVSKYGVFSVPYFPAFGLNTERYEVSLCIQSECGKIRTTKISVFRHFSRSVCFWKVAIKTILTQ